MMNKLDEQYTRTPFYGVNKMTAHLRGQGYSVGRDRVRGMLRGMGLMAIYRKPRLSRPNPDYQVYPYLLKEVTVEKPNQVWGADITYIRLLHGFAYLVAIIDWHSRYVLSWQLSNSLDNSFCLAALDEALLLYGKPEIFNSDQGCQFTSSSFTEKLKAAGIRISMDGRGRVFDNIFVERLWRTVKYENVYIHGYQGMTEARLGLDRYFDFYNNDRFHQALNYQTPGAVYSSNCGHSQENEKASSEMVVARN
jgi:putative transposase